MNKRTLIIIGVIIIIATVAIAGYNYMYKDARNISEEKAEFSLSAKELAKAYSDDSKAANEKFLNKTVAVEGMVSRTEDSLGVLNDVVVCMFDEMLTVKQNEIITVKGRCIGYDELFGEVKLDQCSMVKK